MIVMMEVMINQSRTPHAEKIQIKDPIKDTIKWWPQEHWEALILMMVMMVTTTMMMMIGDVDDDDGGDDGDGDSDDDDNNGER